MTAKEAVRRPMEARRAALDPGWVADASRKVVRRFQSLAAFRSSDTVALYMALAGEVCLDALLPVCWDAGIRTCIPVFDRSSRRYALAEITRKTELAVGHYGVREPPRPILVPLNRIGLMAVPGVAFDRFGNRLGRGGGYYDRLLEGFGGVAAAVAFDFQLLPEVPCGDGDRPVRFIVTPTKIVEAPKER